MSSSTSFCKLIQYFILILQLLVFVSFHTQQFITIEAYSNGQSIPCRDSVAGIEHGSQAGDLTVSKTKIFVNGFVRKPNAIVTIKQIKTNKIIIENPNMVGIMLHIKSNEGKNMIGRYKSTFANVTNMICIDSFNEALIHNTSQFKSRVTSVFDSTKLIGTVTLSITVLYGYSEWYYDIIQMKIQGTAPPTVRPTMSPTTLIPTFAPTKAPIRLCRPNRSSCTSRNQCCSKRCFIRCF